MIKRTALTVVATLVLLLPAAPTVHAASCKGASHAVTLSAGAASPRSGTTATGITFSVRYSSNAGCIPSAVTVDIAGIGAYPLDSSGSDFAAGEVFTRTMTLPAGVHTYTFSATGGTGNGEQSIILTSVNPDAVSITAPTPVPTPSPTPVPPPATPKPPAPPPATPPPATPPPGAQDGPAATPAPPTAGVATPSRTPAPSSDGAPTSPPSPSTIPSAEPAPTDAVASGGPDDDEHDSWIGAPIFAGGDSPTPGKAGLIGGDEGGSTMGLMLSAAAAMGMLLTGILLARRRSRHDRPLAATAGAAVGTGDPSGSSYGSSIPIPDDGPIPAVRPLPPMRELIPPVNPALLDEDAGQENGDGPRAPAEVGIPRWLRPSVREARFANDRDHRRSNWG